MCFEACGRTLGMGDNVDEASRIVAIEPSRARHAEAAESSREPRGAESRDPSAARFQIRFNKCPSALRAPLTRARDPTHPTETNRRCCLRTDWEPKPLAPVALVLVPGGTASSPGRGGARRYSVFTRVRSVPCRGSGLLQLQLWRR